MSREQNKSNLYTHALSGLKAFNSFTAQIAKYLTAIMLAINLTIVFLGVAFRYFLGHPLGWVYEIAIFLMMWSAFIGSVALCKQQGHVALDFLVDRFRQPIKQSVKVVMELGVIILMAIIINYSIVMIEGLAAAKSAYLRIPMYWVYSSVPVGMSLIILQEVEHLIDHCTALFSLHTHQFSSHGK